MAGAPSRLPYLSKVHQMDDRSRVTLSIAIVLAGIILAVAAGSLVSEAETDQAKGTVIDYGDRDTVWTETDIHAYQSTQELLEHACESNGLALVQDDGGDIVSIGDVVSSDGSEWGLWVVYPGSIEWVHLDAPYTQDPSEFTITSWSYVAEGEEPTVAVDYSGNPIYGYQQKLRVVSLSPSITEILGSVKAENIIVGVDSYSDHPQSVVDAARSGKIATVGTYTSPSFELIMGTNPDVVFADSSQRSHSVMMEQLRSTGVDSVLLYPGEDLESIMDNIFIVGTVINYELAAEEVIQDTYEVIDLLAGHVFTPEAGGNVDLMISLEPDISPWVSGSGTYLSSISGLFNSTNVFSEWGGWVHVTSDRVPHANPDKIIIVTSEYSATQAEYDYLYSNLPAQWKDTEAWRNGEVYVICESAADMVQRFGPRTAQVAELVAMILHPTAFDTEVPKIIGDGYEQYLSYSSYMGYD